MSSMCMHAHTHKDDKKVKRPNKELINKLHYREVAKKESHDSFFYFIKQSTSNILQGYEFFFHLYHFFGKVGLTFLLSSSYFLIFFLHKHLQTLKIGK